VDIVIMCD